LLRTFSLRRYDDDRTERPGKRCWTTSNRRPCSVLFRWVLRPSRTVQTPNHPPHSRDAKRGLAYPPRGFLFTACAAVTTAAARVSVRRPRRLDLPESPPRMMRAEYDCRVRNCPPRASSDRLILTFRAISPAHELWVCRGRKRRPTLPGWRCTSRQFSAVRGLGPCRSQPRGCSTGGNCLLPPGSTASRALSVS